MARSRCRRRTTDPRQATRAESRAARTIRPRPNRRLQSDRCGRSLRARLVRGPVDLENAVHHAVKLDATPVGHAETECNPLGGDIDWTDERDEEIVPPLGERHVAYRCSGFGGVAISPVR